MEADPSTTDVAAGPDRRRAGVSLALLAGGASRRMGIDKATAPLVGGVNVLEWVRDRITPLFEHAFVVANEPARFRSFGLPVVTDALPERGSAVGVYTALLASPTDRVLCLACDMPFVTSEVLRALVDGSPGYQVFVPRQGPYLQPLCAVYAVTAATAYEEFLAAGGRRVDEVFRVLHTGYLEVGDGRFGDPDVLFLNTNTPEELEQARRLARELVSAGAGPIRRGPVASEAGEPAVEVHRSLADRVRTFVARSPIPVVSFVGKKKSGKTTVLEGVIRELAGRGLRVAVVKHDLHGFDPDVPGTDSYRLRHAGAVVTGISSPEMHMWIAQTTEEPTLEDLVSHLTEQVDLLITEGFKRQPAPKIEVSRRERSISLVCEVDELVGIVSDQRFADYPVPQLDMDDFAGIADLIERAVFPLWHEPGPAPTAEGHAGDDAGGAGGPWRLPAAATSAAAGVAERLSKDAS